MRDNEIDRKDRSDTDRESDVPGDTGADREIPEQITPFQLENTADTTSAAASQPVRSGSNSSGTELAANASGFGQRLRGERIKQGLNIGEVARGLRLSEQQVEAIETQDFSRLPAATFLRGYIRNYANLLQLDDVNGLLEAVPLSRPASAAYADRNMSQRFKAIAPVSRRSRNSRGGWLYVIVILVAFAAYGLYQENDPEQEASYLSDSRDSTVMLSDTGAGSGQAAIDLALPLPSPAVELPVAPPAARNGGASSEGAVGPNQPALSEPVTDATSVLDNGKKSLHFSFSRDSWVKIKDSDGKIILEKIHHRGTEQTIEGKPPLYLVIGNAPGVSLTYNGREIDLTPYTRGNDDVARFSLE